MGPSLNGEYAWLVKRSCENKSEMSFQLAVTTAALAVPLLLLRRQRVRASRLSKSGSFSMLASVPPVRRAPTRGVPSTAPPPRVASVMTPASTKVTHSVEASGPLQMSSGAPSRVAKEDGFNGALYTLKAFGIATALVLAGGAASVWGVKTYLGVRDVCKTKLFLASDAHTRADPGVRVRDAPHAPHQVAAPRLAHPSRVRLASAASAHFAAGDNALLFRTGCGPATITADCITRGRRVDLAGCSGAPRGGVRAWRGRATCRDGCWRAGG